MHIFNIVSQISYVKTRLLWNWQTTGQTYNRIFMKKVYCIWCIEHITGEKLAFGCEWHKIDSYMISCHQYSLSFLSFWGHRIILKFLKTSLYKLRITTSSIVSLLLLLLSLHAFTVIKYSLVIRSSDKMLIVKIVSNHTFDFKWRPELVDVSSCNVENNQHFIDVYETSGRW